MVILAQTDTTIGFLSKNPVIINQKKGAKESKPLLLEVPNLSYIPYRVPVKFRSMIRRAKKTSFILKNQASFRIVSDSYWHHTFLQYFGNAYSSSANPTKKDFDLDFALDKCDAVILDKRGLFPSQSSRIIKIGANRLIKIR